MLTDLMTDNNTREDKNSAYHTRIKYSGSGSKVELQSSSLSREIVERLEVEEDLLDKTQAPSSGASSNSPNPASAQSTQKLLPSLMQFVDQKNMRLLDLR